MKRAFEKVRKAIQQPLLLLSAIAVSVVAWGLVVLILVGPGAAWTRLKSGTFDITELGALGDSFAVLTCLFSGFAFAGVLISLSAQRAEMREMRAQMRLDRSTQLLMLLMEKFMEIRSEITINKGSARERKGSDAVFSLQDDLLKQLKAARAADESAGKAPIDSLKAVMTRSAPNSTASVISVSFDHYFRVVASIIELLNDVDPGERDRYRAVVNSMFSTSDYFLIHMWFQATKDPPFHKAVADAGFFSSLGAIFALVMLGDGPFYDPAAYGASEEMWKKLSEKNASLARNPG